MIAKNATRRLVMLHSAAILIFGAQAVHASNVGVDLNINIGSQPRQVPAPAPVYVPAPAPVYVPAPAPFVVEPDVHFIYPERLGFYVAVGVPYDLFYLDNSYFIFRDGRWLRAQSSRGPWVVQRHRDLPPLLRRQRLERIREYRNHEYGVYRRDIDHYRGRQFRADRGEWKERDREIRERRKEEKHFAKEQRKEEKRWEKERRKEDKRLEKEARKEHRGGHDD
jgi:hypothetical protein